MKPNFLGLFPKSVRINEIVRSVIITQYFLYNSGLGFSFGGKAWTEMEIWCVKGMHKLKLVSSEKNSGFKGQVTFRWALLTTTIGQC